MGVCRVAGVVLIGLGVIAMWSAITSVGLIAGLLIGFIGLASILW